MIIDNVGRMGVEGHVVPVQQVNLVYPQGSVVNRFPMRNVPTPALLKTQCVVRSVVYLVDSVKELKIYVNKVNVYV